MKGLFQAQPWALTLAAPPGLSQGLSYFAEVAEAVVGTAHPTQSRQSWSPLQPRAPPSSPPRASSLLAPQGLLPACPPGPLPCVPRALEQHISFP